MDHDVNGNTTEQYNITMRRYACMALTNLTFGDGTNKALLCSMKSCMRALVAQLHSPNEDLRQVAASVLRNLSWRADLASKKTLREVGAVTALMCASMEVKKESTLKSILSALWNLSAHCSENKADICAVDGSLAFLVSTLTYKSPSKTLAIIENGGGILRNISSHIAVREDYRKILRQHGCLQILLKHLRSPSLTIVSNACGTLWNLSARCPEDQKALWEMGAVSMLRNLVHSKHKMISMGSAAALKNLLAAKPAMVNLDLDRHTKSNMPSLHVRKQRALEAELDQNLAETCDNVESPQGSPTETRKHIPGHEGSKFMYTTENCGIYQVTDNEHRRSMMRGHHLSRNLSGENSPRSPQRSVSRSASQDSVGSTHSDISYDRNRVQDVLRKSSKLLQERQNMNLDRRRDHSMRYNNSGHVGEGMRTSGSDSSITDRARGSGPNSRIMQVMHEVAVHAGIDPGPFTKEQYGPNLQESQSAEGTPQNARRSQSSEPQSGRRAMPMFIPREGQSFNCGQPGMGESPPDEVDDDDDLINNVSQQEDGRGMHFANLSHRMENLHLKDDEDDPVEDEPINYSMKYSESPRSDSGDQNTSATFVKPVAKVGSVVPTTTSQQVKPQPATSVVPPNNKQVNNINNMNIPQYSGYAETDLDNEEMDQPTNYSIRFAEHTDDGHFTDQPINYSTRYKEPEGSCVECKMEAHRCNEYVEHLEPHIDDDTIRTFYTEGTPLNYLSTATSMNDLSGKANKYATEDHKDQSGGSMPPPSAGAPVPRKAFSDTCASHSHHQTGAGPVKHNSEAANIQNNNVPGVKSVSTPQQQQNQQQANLYYDDDTSASASPSEKPTKYCTEGTPTSFSRVSSLSSLHSSDAQDHTSSTTESRNRDDLVLESIDENTSLEITTSADVTLRQPENQNDSYQSSANTTTGSQGNDSISGTPAKSVTFDDNNQVQETPLMFSRCSSLGSLSSFDAHSVHSSVVSEYSRRASEVVSPSDLPDSPSDTMPPSPTHRKSPIKFLGNDAGAEESDEENEADVTQIEKLPTKANSTDSKRSSEKTTPDATTHSNESALYNDLTVRFAEEESPPGFSCASSLSRLTIDDEPHIEKDSNLRRVPLGQENDRPDVKQDVAEVEEEPENIAAVPKEPTSPITSVDLDDDDDLSVSEGEEDMLAACINLAMPNNSKKKMRRSTSDSHLRKKAGLTKVNNLGPGAGGGSGMVTSTPTSKSRLPMKVPNIAHVAPMTPYGRASAFSPRMNASYHGHLSHHDDPFDAPDTPQKFATEGTPLNFSNAGSLGGSLSDLSLGDEQQHLRGDGESEVYHTPGRPSNPACELDDKSDISSLSEECEDLLSEAIEAAMPKNKSKAKKMDRVAEGSDSKLRMRYHIPAFKAKKATVDSQQGAPNHRTVSLPSDTVMNYATEGTPLNFSTANSLSDLSCDGSELNESSQKETKLQPKAPVPEVLPPPAAYQDTSRLPAASAFDSPRVFGIEGTPVSFSRNDSLSSLSCDEDADLEEDKEKLKAQGPRGHVSPGGSVTPPSKGGAAKSRIALNRRIGQLSGSSTPAAAPVNKGRVQSRAHRSLQYGEGSDAAVSTDHHHDPPDQAHSYAVEGTPNCFSRNSSLSSLNSDDHEGLAQRNSGSGSNENSPEPAAARDLGDHSASFQVEDTPRVFSRNSSLSSLSVESLSYEPTASEKALLEECINAAMPKSKPSARKKKGSSPSSGSAPRIPKMKTSRSEESSLLAAGRGAEEEPSKNVRASQSKNESITEESRGPNDASGLVFRRSASEGSKTRFGWRRPSSQESNNKQCKEEYNQEQVLGNNNTAEGAGSTCEGITGDPFNFDAVQGKVIDEQDNVSDDSDVKHIPPPSDFDNDTHIATRDLTLENSVHLGEQNENLQNVFMEMPTSALESDPDKQRISDDDFDMEATTDKEQKAIGINEKDHCSEPSESEDVDSVGSSHSVGERNNFGHTKERASFYLEGNLDDSHMACPALEDTEEVPDFMDITAETFPKSMEVSLISDISTPGEDHPPPFVKDFGGVEDCTDYPEPPDMFNDSANDSLTLDSYTNLGTPVVSSEDTTVVDATDLEEMLEMSPEQERALEENASLIVSELSLTRQLSSCTLDDDAFIENETISLVSNDCMSDTASEASIALSSSSKTVSEQASESSTVSLHSSAPSVGPKSPGARIVKPGLSRFRKPEEETDGSKTKGIRGKRRSLFSRVTPKPLKSPSPPPGKGIRGGGGTPTKNKPKEQPKEQQSKQASATSKPPTKPQPRLRTPPPPKNTSRLSAKSVDGTKTTPPKVPPRDSSLKAANSSSQRTASPSTSATSKVTPISPKTAQSSKLTTPPKGGLSKITSRINTGLPKLTSKGKDSPKTKAVEPERPPPPVKQGTFTKDEPTLNAPEINGHNSDKRASVCSQGSNRSSAELKYSSESQEKLTRGAAGTSSPKRNSSGSMSERPGSWSRSLDCDSDIPLENGIQKSSSPAALTAVRKSSSGSVSKSSSSGSLGKVSKSSSNSSMGKTGSTGSVNKSSSNTSVNKLGSKSPLTKTNSGPTGKKTSAVSPMRKATSNTSLGKTTTVGAGTSKTDIKKSESQASLGQKTGLASPRPSTPPSRKLSAGSSSTPSPAVKKSVSPSSGLTGLKKPQAVGGKKPAVSKIAGLWRKEDKSPARSSTESVKSVESDAKKPTKSALKSPKPARRSLLSVVKPTSDKKKEEAEKKRQELTRSSTYDKLPLPDSAEEGTSGGDDDQLPAPNAGTKRQWRRTYTIDPEAEVLHDIENGLDTPTAIAESTPKPKKSPSIWRRNTADSDKIEVKHTKEAAFSSKKLGAWKKSSSEDMAHSTEDSPAPQSKLAKPGSSSMWMKRSGSLIPSPAGKAQDKALTNGHHNGPSVSAKSATKHPQPLSAISPTSDEKTMTVSSPKGELNAAIVPPYNYTPTQKVTSKTTTPPTTTTTTLGGSGSPAGSNSRMSPVRIGKLAKQQFTEVTYQSDEGVVSVQGLAPSKPKSSSVATKPLTKTEMLIARRRQSYLNSRNKGEKAADDEKSKSACLVTTV